METTKSVDLMTWITPCTSTARRTNPSNHSSVLSCQSANRTDQYIDQTPTRNEKRQKIYIQSLRGIHDAHNKVCNTNDRV
jgi:hypothetical protein